MSRSGDTLYLKCKKCGVHKAPDDFYKHKHNATGRDGTCKECRRLADREKYAANPDARNYRQKRSTYGLSQEEFLAMYEKQEGKCAICETHICLPREGCGTKSTANIDHIHDKTRKVRGLLCGRCNMGLGIFGDGEELLERALNYVRSTK